MSDHEQELHDKTRDIVSDVLDLIAGDAEFREALKTDPTLALQTAGFASRIDDLFDEVEADAEVSGFASFAPRPLWVRPCQGRKRSGPPRKRRTHPALTTEPTSSS